MFQMDRALLGVAADLRGKLPDFHHVGHYLSPVMGQTTRGTWTASASFRNRRPVGSVASPDPGDRGWGSSPVQYADTVTFQTGYGHGNHRRPAFRVC
jgi:hypothetical protein